MRAATLLSTETLRVAGKSSNQEQNVAGGDIAGGDIVHHHSHHSKPASTLRELASKLRLQAEGDELNGFIAQLQHFTKPPAYGPNKDLEYKLHAASRDDLLGDALEWKEQFYKKLLSLQFSQQAQELFVHILSKIHTFFAYKIRPKVLVGASRAEIDDLIYTLIEELYGEVGDSELDITMTDLQGMVYFLAGNCHIDWN